MKRRDFNKNLIGLAALFGIGARPVEEKKVTRHGVRYDNPTDNTFINRSDRLWNSVKESHTKQTELTIQSKGKQIVLQCTDITLSIEAPERIECTTVDSFYPEYVYGSREANVTVQTHTECAPYLTDIFHHGELISCRFKDKFNCMYECEGYVTSIELNETFGWMLDIVVSGAIGTT